MTRCRVIKRWLMNLGVGLPILFEQLECGHVVIDPGLDCHWRLCKVCNGIYGPPPVKGILHLAVSAKKRAPSFCGRRVHTHTDYRRVTCLNCLRSLVRHWRVTEPKLPVYTYWSDRR